jgi:hypothetical protein
MSDDGSDDKGFDELNLSDGNVSGLTSPKELSEGLLTDRTTDDTFVITEEEECDEQIVDPLQRIVKHALRLSHLTHERAFAIDDLNLGKKLGEYNMARLMEIFFDRIYKDATEPFR